MNPRWCIALACLLGWTTSAHRLDDLLQAVRIGVERDRVELSLRITPGSLLADELVSVIDLDADGEIAAEEANAFAVRVLGDLEVTLDQVPLAVRLGDVGVPNPGDLRAGAGVFRIEAYVPTTGLRPGAHVLGFTNNHLPDFSVYLVNALKPESDAVQILKQSRSHDQRAYELEFVIKEAPASPASPSSSTAARPTS